MGFVRRERGFAVDGARLGLARRIRQPRLHVRQLASQRRHRRVRRRQPRLVGLERVHLSGQRFHLFLQVRLRRRECLRFPACLLLRGFRRVQSRLQRVPIGPRLVGGGLRLRHLRQQSRLFSSELLGRCRELRPTGLLCACGFVRGDQLGLKAGDVRLRFFRRGLRGLGRHLGGAGILVELRHLGLDGRKRFGEFRGRRLRSRSRRGQRALRCVGRFLRSLLFLRQLRVLRRELRLRLAQRFVLGRQPGFFRRTFFRCVREGRRRFQLGAGVVQFRLQGREIGGVFVFRRRPFGFDLLPGRDRRARLGLGLRRSVPGGGGLLGELIERRLLRRRRATRRGQLGGQLPNAGGGLGQGRARFRELSREFFGAGGGFLRLCLCANRALADRGQLGIGNRNGGNFRRRLGQHLARRGEIGGGLLQLRGQFGVLCRQRIPGVRRRMGLVFRLRARELHRAKLRPQIRQSRARIRRVPAGGAQLVGLHGERVVALAQIGVSLLQHAQPLVGRGQRRLRHRQFIDGRNRRLGLRFRRRRHLGLGASHRHAPGQQARRDQRGLASEQNRAGQRKGGSGHAAFFEEKRPRCKARLEATISRRSAPEKTGGGRISVFV